jgi:hypothetical protein
MNNILLQTLVKIPQVTFSASPKYSKYNHRGTSSNRKQRKPEQRHERSSIFYFPSHTKNASPSTPPSPPTHPHRPLLRSNLPPSSRLTFSINNSPNSLNTHRIRSPSNPSKCSSTIPKPHIAMGRRRLQRPREPLPSTPLFQSTNGKRPSPSYIIKHKSTHAIWSYGGAVESWSITRSDVWWSKWTK